MNKESSNTLVRRGRATDKVIIVAGVALIVAIITFTAFKLSHIGDGKTNDKQPQTQVEEQTQIEVE